MSSRGNKKELTDEQQRFAVQLLACFRTPTEVAVELKKQFKVKVERQLAEHYDPTKVAGQNLREDLQRLFWETRTAYLERADNFGIAHQVRRLDLLQHLLDLAIEAGNSVEAREIMKQAAQELGGAYTNKRELSGPNGKPIETVSLSLDDWKKQAAERRAQAESTMQLFTEG